MPLQVRVDVDNFNTSIIQNVAPMLLDVARSAIHAVWAQGYSGGSTSHNRQVCHSAIDIATRTPGTPVVVEAGQTANDIETAICSALLANGDLIAAYGAFGVGARESTDGGTTWSGSRSVVDGTWGLSTRAIRALPTWSNTAWAITKEMGGGGTQYDLYSIPRTGVNTWGSATKIFDSNGTTFYEFNASGGGTCVQMLSATAGCLVGDYSNNTSNYDQIRALYTTDGWATATSVLIKDYTGGGSVLRRPVLVKLSDNTLIAIWIEGGDPVLSYSTNGGANWTFVGAPSGPDSEPWSAQFERAPAVQDDDTLILGAWDSLDYHIWRGPYDATTGWADTPMLSFPDGATSGSVGDAIVADGAYWRLYIDIDSPTYKLTLLVSDALTPPDPVIVEAEQPARGNVILATITLPTLGGNPEKILHLSNRPYVDPNGLRWDPLIRESPPIDHGGDYMETDIQLVDAVLSLMNYRIGGQGLNERLANLFTLYRFNGARCHIQQGLVGVTNLKTLIDGEINEVDKIARDGIDLHVVQDQKFDDDWPPDVVEKVRWPDAPKDSIGVVEPVVFGDWKTRRENEATFNSPGYLYGLARGPHGTIPVKSEGAVSGDNFPTSLISARQMQSLEDAVYIYEPSVKQYAKNYLPGTGTNPVGGPATEKLATRDFVICILPNEPHSTNTADNPMEACREDKPIDMSGFALLDFNANKKRLAIKLPQMDSLGPISHMEVTIAYSKNGAGAIAPRFGFEIDAHGFLTFIGGNTQYSNLGLGAAGYPSNVPVAVAVMVVDLTKLGDWSGFGTARLVAEVRDTGQVMQVHRLVINPRYTAPATIVKEGRFPQAVGTRIGALIHATRDVTQFESSMFTYPLGLHDEDHAVGADGEYTGSAGALIENPVDLVRCLAREFGGAAANEIKTTGYGSFVSARAALASYKVFGASRTQQKLSDFIEDLSSQTLCWFMRQPTEPHNPWVAIPWDVGATPNYRTPTDLFTFKRNERHVALNTFAPFKTRASSVRNVVRVNYDWDPVNNRFADQLFISDTDSRVYSAGSFTTDGAREAVAAESVLAVGRKVWTLNLRFVKDPDTATDILTRAFDLRCLPKTGVRFHTFVQAFDLNRGHVIGFDADWNSLIPFPREGSDGSWANKAMRVTRVKRLKGTVVRYEVEAVEAA